jgi:hypothetical protein
MAKSLHPMSLGNSGSTLREPFSENLIWPGERLLGLKLHDLVSRQCPEPLLCSAAKITNLKSQGTGGVVVVIVKAQPERLADRASAEWKVLLRADEKRTKGREVPS